MENLTTPQIDGVMRLLSSSPRQYIIKRLEGINGRDKYQFKYLISDVEYASNHYLSQLLIMKNLDGSWTLGCENGLYETISAALQNSAGDDSNPSMRV